MKTTKKKAQKIFPEPLKCAEEYFKSVGNVDSITAYIAGFKTARDLRFNEFMSDWENPNIGKRVVAIAENREYA
jgi:hypothetical protein